MAKFNLDIKIKSLLWSDRHCCVCKKPCGVDIEVAHIDQKDKNPDNLVNAIPVCYECHSKIGHYRSEHPRGNKFSFEELKRRREQVYEEYTRHLVPPIHFEITQNLRDGRQRSFPDIGFNIMHMGDSLPVKVQTKLEIFLGGVIKDSPKGHYSGEEFWNLNPRLGYTGHFSAPIETVNSLERFEIKVYVTIIDQYDRPHELLPVSWVYERNGNYWWANP